MNTNDKIGLYGAIVSTLVALSQGTSYYLNRRTRIKVSSFFFFRLHVNIVNTGEKPKIIDYIVFERNGYESMLPTDPEVLPRYVLQPEEKITFSVDPFDIDGHLPERNKYSWFRIRKNYFRNKIRVIAVDTTNKRHRSKWLTCAYDFPEDAFSEQFTNQL